ncbi:leucine-rich repeat-containing protein 59 [Chelonus insularis]|uniref:leucine-rich repeat-containing protein 59 n=1 Tax=Chelonus insularis TaxID=460826 RepID=UPI0015894AF1|nr:leucine-rich repeat-containing protein 59 [Chelonus insularis]
MTVKIKVKDKLEDDILDLSFCDLREVPIKEIAPIKKASQLDLSNNQLVSLPNSIITLSHIVKLVLSKNMLTEIPENIGEMRQLRHLDLYSNQISRLPLSMAELKNLKWLDLKDNPLTSAVASVAGPCSNSNECKACARNIVSYLIRIKQSIEDEKLKRTTVNNTNEGAVKKESKKKKKKNLDKGDSAKSTDKVSEALIAEKLATVGASDEKKNEVKNYLKNSEHSNNRKICSLLGKIFYSTILSILIAILFIPLALILLPKYDQSLSNDLMSYLQTQTNLPAKHYQEIGIKKFNEILEQILIIFDNLKILTIDYYEKIISNFK